ncbi:hypothetical protein QQF92_05820 [Melissococcus plutonius]|uniref:hypothetical protein n=1 Tax=Melissococcus plutonius TaxID=33970 RepID=UPI003EE64FA1
MKKDLFIAINLQLFSKREKENRMELLTDPKKNTLVPISSDRNNKKKRIEHLHEKNWRKY